MSSFISAAPVASGQVQSLDGLRAHSLPTDAMILASSSLVTPTNQNTGSYALVESANALTLTTTGSVPVVTQSPFADLYKEGSLYFSGSTGNYLSTTATGLSGTQWKTTGMTVEAWVNYTTFAGAASQSGSSNQPNLLGFGGFSWQFGSNISGNASFYYWTNGTTPVTYMATTPLSTNTWNHITFTCTSSGTGYMFINGVQSQILTNTNGTITGPASTVSITGTPTLSGSTLYLNQNIGGTAGVSGYVADVRVVTGAALYTSTFTVPSAPLSTAATGVTQALIRAGQNSPTIQNGALTFDRGLKQFMNFGPQTFNVATRGFCAIFKITLTGVISSYEYIWQMSAGTPRFAFIRNGTTTTWYAFYLGAGGETDTGLVTIPQNTTSVVAVNYNPSVGTNGTWSVWLNGVNATSVAMGANTPIDFTASTLTQIGNLGGTQSFSANVFAFYNRALSNVEIYNSYLALNTVPATPLQKTLEIGDINGTPALSVAGGGKVFMDSVGLTSNVVPWPPSALQGYDTVINGGVYKARASNEISQFAWQSFDGSTSTGCFFGVYNSSGFDTSGYTTLDMNGTSYAGGWLQIQLPIPVTLSNYIMNFEAASNYTPRAFWILGSRDGVNWVQVHWVPSWTVAGGSTTFTLPTPAVQAFSYFRMVVNKTGGSSGVAAYVREWTLYGTADTSPPLTIAPATTFNTSVATPSLTGIAGSAFVPQDFSSSGLNIPAYVVSNTATVANTVAFTSFGPFAGEGSLYFPGGWGAGVTFQSSVTSLNYDFFATDNTIEMWIYFQKLNQGNILGRMPTSSYGTGGGTYEWILYATSSNYPSLVWNGTGTTSVTSSTAFVAQTWNHLAVVNSGTSVLLFLNGALVGSATKTTTTYNSASLVNLGAPGNNTGASGLVLNTNIACVRFIRGSAVYTAAFTPSTQPLTAIQGVTQAGTPYGTVLLLRNAPAPGRIQTTKFSGANSVGLGGAPQVLSFPPAAMTGYSTALNSGYGQGTYVASASNEFDSGSNTLWRAFDKSTSTLWTGDGSSYTSGNYVKSPPVTTVDVNGTSYQGEWIQLQMPSSIVLSSYAINAPGSQGPSLFYLLGSRDGVNWSLVDQRSGQVPVSTWQTYTVSATQSFTYFRLVTNKISGGSSYVQIFEIVLNGSIESVNVTPDGRVGLGVVNPTRALEVAGDVVCAGTLSAGNPLMFRNVLINGAMVINQRGVSTTLASPTAIGTAGTGLNYGLDRWNGARGAFTTNGTVAQGTLATTDLPFNAGIVNFLRVGRVAGDTSTYDIYVNQAIESREAIKLAGQPLTASMYYRTGPGFSGTGVRLNMTYGTGTDQNAILGYTGQVNITSPLFPPSNAWQRVSFTTFIPPTATEISIYAVETPVGTAPANEYFDITGVQLEKGTVATPFEVRPYGTELALCQRYYQKSYSIATAPGTATESGNWAWYLPVAIGSTANWIQSGPNLQVSMRTAPAIVLYNSAGNVTTAWNALDGSTGTAWRYLNNTSGGSLGPAFLGYGWTASAEL